MYFPDWFLWLIVIVGHPLTWIVGGAVIVAALVYAVRVLREKD